MAKISTFSELNFDSYVAVFVAVALLPAEVIYWTDSKTLKHESFTDQNM